MNKAVDALREAYAGLGQDVRHLDDAALLRQALGSRTEALPAWAAREPWALAERLRDDAARTDGDVSGMTDLELVARECTRLAAESRRHENAYTSLLQGQVKEHRAVRTEAHRSAMATVAGMASYYVQAIVQEQVRTLQEVIHRAQRLPGDGRAAVGDVRELREAADRVPEYLVTRQAMDDAQASPDVRALEELRTEVRRLHRVVRAEGQKLHASGERTPGILCECSGCELIRTVNDVEGS